MKIKTLKNLCKTSSFCMTWFDLSNGTKPRHFCLPCRQWSRFGVRFGYFEARTTTKMKVGIFVIFPKNMIPNLTKFGD